MPAHATLQIAYTITNSVVETIASNTQKAARGPVIQAEHLHLLALTTDGTD